LKESTVKSPLWDELYAAIRKAALQTDAEPRRSGQEDNRTPVTGAIPQEAGHAGDATATDSHSVMQAREDRNTYEQ